MTTGWRGYIEGKTDNNTTSTPTQAQIEAVAIAICKSKTCEGINCCQWPANGGKRRDHSGQPVQCNVKIGAYNDAAKAALTAAAEAGEPLSKEPGGNTFRIQEKLRVQKISDQRLQDATIERCAERAHLHLWALGYKIAATKAAAAIRAMKDNNVR